MAITLSDPFCVERHRDEFLRMIRADVDLLVANEHELQSLYLSDDLEAAMARAEAEVPLTACTVGARGAHVLGQGERVHAPATKVEVVDATGAGDLFAAGFLFGLTGGRDRLTAARMGCLAAGEVISHVGARPEADLRELFGQAGLTLSVGAPDPADIPAAPPRRDNPRLGITLMIATSFVFACQDGMSRYLGTHYNVITVVMIRYWFFALFVIALAQAQKGGIPRVAATSRPWMQIIRGILLALEICVTVLSFVMLGLIPTHAIFAIYPLLVAALAGPVLGEHVGWRRRVAIGVGLVGILVILRPGAQVMSVSALIPFTGALLFAVYAILTRMVGRTDGAETSLFYTGVAGAVAITLVGPFFWTPIHGAWDWFWMLTLCAFGVLGHFLMIKAYEVAEAGTIQPFAYFQIVWVTIMALVLFGERPDRWTVAGGALILAAGLYTLVRQARLGRSPKTAEDEDL